ncbi:MAG: Enoyl-[acyl-carrier-protein] reductase [Labilithrix sp.]|nr:Enoyl-[acyl-carrier-protein] reductase [Labilithrix sp.]
MTAWPDSRLLDLLAIEHPILQAPMAGVTTVAMCLGVARAGGLAGWPCALAPLATTRAAIAAFREQSARPLNLNFFCHAPATADPAIEQAWRARLAPYFVENGLDPEQPLAPSTRAPFDDTFCALVEETRPEVVSFHFGLPAAPLLARVKATGATILSSATTVREARWLAERGVDAVIAMGAEAGGHRGSFLDLDMASQVGTMALVPRVVDAVAVPVIAAGGIGDARGIVASFALGASGVQLGTAYLRCPEATVTPEHRRALASSNDDTVITNVFTGRPARSIASRLVREVGPLSPLAPPFPLAGGALAPLRATPNGAREFANLWAGQAASLGTEEPAAELTARLARESLERLAPQRQSMPPRPPFTT